MRNQELIKNIARVWEELENPYKIRDNFLISIL